MPAQAPATFVISYAAASDGGRAVSEPPPPARAARRVCTRSQGFLAFVHGLGVLAGAVMAIVHLLTLRPEARADLAEGTRLA
jgi:hypothetical protein